MKTILELGDNVSWFSSSFGSTTQKTGIIEQVVLPNMMPDRDRFPNLYSGAGIGKSRDHESYVVRVPGATSKAAGKIYWPRAGSLRLGKP